MVLDPRHMSRPGCFDGTQEGSYDEWLQLVAHVDLRFGDVADDVACWTKRGGRLVSCSRQSLWVASRTDICA